MSFRFIQSEASYPEIFRVNVTDRTCTVSDFDMKCRNIYTKTEVDDLIAAGGGGGGGGSELTGKILNLEDGLKQSQFEMKQDGLHVTNQGNYLMLATNDTITVGSGAYNTLDIRPHGIKYTYDDSTYETQCNVLGNLLYSATNEGITLGTMTNIYTKEEVDQKIWFSDIQCTGEWTNVTEAVKTYNKGNKLSVFRTGWSSMSPTTVFNVASTVNNTLEAFSLAVCTNTKEVYAGFCKTNDTQEIQSIEWIPLQTAQASQTITHEAPFTGEADEYSVGDPVFATGRACKYDRSSNEWTYETGPTDCICEVKPEGTVGEYMGICVGFNENTKSLIFATHGDYYFNVADSSKYKIGDVILLDGTVLKDDMALTGKVMKMIVGRVTAKINKTTVAVLKD